MASRLCSRLAAHQACVRAHPALRAWFSSRLFTNGAISRGSRTRACQVLRFDQTGDYQDEVVTITELMKETELHARDFIDLDSRGFSRPTTRILPHRKCFIISASHIKAIVQRDSVILFDVDGSAVKSFARGLRRVLKDPAVSETYEMRALEAVLNSVRLKYDRRMSCYSPVVESLLEQLQADYMNTELLSTFLPLKNGLRTFGAAAEELVSALTDLINSDEDMVELMLTEKARSGGVVDPALHSEVELLLENYRRQYSDVSHEVINISRRISDTEELVNLRLDSYRNRMIRVNLQLAMGAVGLSFGTVIAGLFGMNLVSGLEEHPFMFYLASASCVLVSSGFYAACNQYSSAMGAANPQERARETALLTVDTDIQDELLEMVERLTHVSKGQFHRMLSESMGRPVPSQQVADIFNAFDEDNDGVMTRTEVQRFLCHHHSQHRTRFS